MKCLDSLREYELHSGPFFELELSEKVSHCHHLRRSSWFDLRIGVFIWEWCATTIQDICISESWESRTVQQMSIYTWHELRMRPHLRQRTHPTSTSSSAERLGARRIIRAVFVVDWDIAVRRCNFFFSFECGRRRDVVDNLKDRKVNLLSRHYIGKQTMWILLISKTHSSKHCVRSGT